MKEPLIKVIIPALNEEKSLPKVLKAIPHFVSEIVVVDNGSTDTTFKVAVDNGATALQEPIKGYGRACLTGIDYLKTKAKPEDIVVFLDADFSDDPKEMKSLTGPIIENEYDFIVGSRALGQTEKGSMTFPQKFGNWLSGKLLKSIYNADFTDLGPFRAIRWSSLESLKMQDQNFGWTVEMQVKAAKNKLRFKEVPVSYKKRIGKSKVSGTVKGTLMAGYKILWTIFKNI